MSLFDDDVKGLLPMIGQSTTYDNRQTFDVLGWEPTPFEDSMREMAASISG